MTTIQERETTTVRVFKDSPEFDQVEKWWMLPIPTLQRLHVTDYVVDDDLFADGIAQIKRKHPECVLIY